MQKLFGRFLRNEKGATAIEYGLIAAFMAVCLVAALPKLTNGLNTQFNNIGNKLTNGT